VVLEQPLAVVAADEICHDLSCVLQGAEAVDVETLLLENAYEALDQPVALRLSPEGGGGADPQPLQLTVELTGNVLGPAVVPEREPKSALRRVGSETPLHALPDRLQRRPPIPLVRDVPANDFIGAVVEGCEEPASAIAFALERGSVSAPQLVRPLGAEMPL
jgi:hypothetical protein